MGWGEPHTRPSGPNPLLPEATRLLAAAVRRFLATGTTGDREALTAALHRYDIEAAT